MCCFFRLPFLYVMSNIFCRISKSKQIAQKRYFQKEIMESHDETMPPFLSLQNLLLEFNVCLDFVFNNLIGTKCTISKGESNEKYICNLKSFRHVNFVAPKMQNPLSKRYPIFYLLNSILKNHVCPCAIFNVYLILLKD